MNCEKYSEWISLYIDRELEGKDRSSFEDHMTSCDACREEVQILREITSGIQNLEMIEVPEGFHKEVMEKIKEASGSNQSKVIALPMNKRKWYTNLKIAGAVAAVFIFSTVLIKPPRMNPPKDSMTKMAVMEESQETEDNIKGSRMMTEPTAFGQEGAPAEFALDSEIDSVADASQMPEETPVEEPQTGAKVNPTAEADAMPANQETGIVGATLRRVDTLPIEICTVMTGQPNEDKDYIMGVAKQLGVKPTITETTGSEELQNQVITIEMIINKEQGNELDDKMRGFEKWYEGPNYDQEEGYPETVKRIILVTEYHSRSNQ